jgi:cyclic pyranopterin phosphate synthase
MFDTHGRDDVESIDTGRPAPAPGPTPATAPPLIDPFGRALTYLRVSVTDRCDLRCVYCMNETMTFLPKRDVLSFEELDRITAAFVRLGVRKLRVTGGEPLVRRDILTFFGVLARHLEAGAVDEVTLTTNATLLARYAADLAARGVRRVNVSLDSLDPATYGAITHGGDVRQALAGIAAARRAGLAVKINVVALKGINEGQLAGMLAWCGGEGLDMTLIEVMPMGDIGASNRTDQYLPLSRVRDRLAARWTLKDIPDRTGGPARYVRVAETGRRLGFITPLTNNFCGGCNRVRLTCTGRLYLCLGQSASADLRAVVRASADDGALDRAIRDAVAAKPRGHDFVIDRGSDARPVDRHMNVTGG